MIRIYDLRFPICDLPTFPGKQFRSPDFRSAFSTGGRSSTSPHFDQGLARARPSIVFWLRHTA